MANLDHHIGAFQELLKDLGEEWKSAKEDVPAFQRHIEKYSSHDPPDRVKLSRQLRGLESNRPLAGPGDVRRTLKDLLADPVSAATLLISDSTEKIIKRMEDRVGKRVLAAYEDGLISKPVRLWDYLKCHSADSDSKAAIWTAAVRAWRDFDPSAFTEATGDWSRLAERQIALSLIATHLGEVEGQTTGSDRPRVPKRRQRHENSWREVMTKIEEYLDGHPFPGIRALAEKFECSRDPIRTAIENSKKIRMSMAEVYLLKLPGFKHIKLHDLAQEDIVEELIGILARTTRSESKQKRYASPAFREEALSMDVKQIWKLLQELPTGPEQELLQKLVARRIATGRDH